MENEYLDFISNSLQSIVNNVFSNSDHEKRKIYIRDNRINFSCPYCGDSRVSSVKKRGNLYLNNFYFHCYNCGMHVSLYKLLRDFNIDMDINIKVHIDTLRSLNNHSNNIVNYIYNKDIIKKYGFSRKDIFNKFNLLEIVDSKSICGKKYLNDRLQYNYEYFGYNLYKEQLFIFNLFDGMIMNIKVRNLNSKPKYITYNLEYLYKLFNIKIDDNYIDEFSYVNNLSVIFNLFNIDISKNIIATEGEFDALLLNNAIALSGATNNIPFDIANIYYLFDNDITGKKESIKKIRNKENVFLWSKYLKDMNIFEDIKDITELFIYINSNKLKMIPLVSYFSNDPLDILKI